MPIPRIPRRAPTFLVVTLAIACFLVALFGCASCSTVKPMSGAVVGAGAGTLIGGPVGGAAGAAIGAGAGALWQETTAAQDERAACQAELAAVKADVLELRSTIKANEQIDAYNLTAARKVPHTTPVDADESHWYSHVWVWIAGALGVALSYIFRTTLWAWLTRFARYVVGLLALTRTPSLPPVETPPLDPPHPSDQ